MGFFGFLGAPARFIERITGERASRQKATATAEQMAQHRNALSLANAQSLAQQKRLQKMLDDLSGLDRQQKTLHRSYKNDLKALEYEEQHLRDLGQHYTRTIGKVEAKGNELLARKEQLEQRGANLEEKAVPLEQKLKEIVSQSQQADSPEGVSGEINALVGKFQKQYREVEASRERLKGVSRETSPELFSRHQKLVRELGNLRKETETTIQSKHQELSGTHQRVATELNRLQQDYQGMEAEGQLIRRGQEKLERKKRYVDTYQGMLGPEVKKFEQDQEAFKRQAEKLKTFQQKLDDLEKGYTTKKGEAESLQKELAGTSVYQDQLVNRLQSLQQDLEFHTQRYQERAGRSALIKAGAVGLATLGAGSALGLGTGLTNLATGLTVFGTLNSMKNDLSKNLQKFGAYADFSPEELRAGGIPDWNRTPLNRVDFKSKVFDTKIKMPEFGNLAQSIKHFEMPALPKLAELPSLSDALGKIRSLEDIANLGILPGSTARSPNRSLLNPQLMQTFQSLMKSKANTNRKKKDTRAVDTRVLGETGKSGRLPLPRGGFHYGH